MEKGQPIKVSDLSRRPRIKPFLATTVILLLVAVVVCAVVAVSSAKAAPDSVAVAAALPDDNSREALEARSLVDEPQHKDNSFVAGDAPDSETPRIRAARFLKINENNTQENSNEVLESRPKMINTNPSCFSDISNKTVPAAHIKGKGNKFFQSTQESRTSYPEAPRGYQQKWQCTEIQSGPLKTPVHAFVDGGMCFNQTDKTLGVPVCGYYMVTSQILFSMSRHALEQSKTVYHLMKFKRNCRSHSIEVTVTGKSTVGPYTAENHHAGKVTTFTSDIIKLCAGGKIWIEIPDGDNGVPCCPTGESIGTFITAILVRESTCHWPPDTLTRYLDDN